MWTIGGPSIIVCNGPTFWQCSHAYMFDPMRVPVIIFILGLLRLLFLPKELGGAAPFGGGTTSGFRARRLAPPYGQPPRRRDNRSQMEDARSAQDLQHNGRGTGLTG